MAWCFRCLTSLNSSYILSVILSYRCSSMFYSLPFILLFLALSCLSFSQERRWCLTKISPVTCSDFYSCSVKDTTQVACPHHLHTVTKFLEIILITIKDHIRPEQYWKNTNIGVFWSSAMYSLSTDIDTIEAFEWQHCWISSSAAISVFNLNAKTQKTNN